MNVTAIKITAQKINNDFNNEKVEITLNEESYDKLTNQLFRFIQNQLAEIRKES